MSDVPVIAKIEDINQEFAARAFHGTSFDPEKRGESRRQDYVNAVQGLYETLWPIAVTDEQKAVLAEQMENFRLGYLERMKSFLGTHSSCVSTMIAGPANFPVARQEKIGRWAHARLTELISWNQKGEERVKKAVLAARPQEAKDNAEWLRVKHAIECSLTTIRRIDSGEERGYNRAGFVTNMVGRIERLAENGHVELVEKAIEFIREYNAANKKAAVTARHKFWTFGDLAKAAAAAMVVRVSGEREKIGEAPGVELWSDPQLDRVQLIFEEKPAAEVRSKLVGWKWAPSQGAWQRQLTLNGLASGKFILAEIVKLSAIVKDT